MNPTGSLALPLLLRCACVDSSLAGPPTIWRLQSRRLSVRSAPAPCPDGCAQPALFTLPRKYGPIISFSWLVNAFSVRRCCRRRRRIGGWPFDRQHRHCSWCDITARSPGAGCRCLARHQLMLCYLPPRRCASDCRSIIKFGALGNRTASRTGCEAHPISWQVLRQLLTLCTVTARQASG